MFNPPPGFDDVEDECDRAPSSPGYHELDVPGVGIVRARRPMPNSLSALANASRADVSDESRADYLTLFVRNHLDMDELERIFAAQVMADADMPADAIPRIARAISTWGTGRPTRP